MAKRTAQLDPLLDAIGQAGPPGVCGRLDLEEIDDVLDTLRLAISSLLAAPIHSMPAKPVFLHPDVPAGEDVVDHRHLPKRAMFWNVRAMPNSATASGRLPMMLWPAT